VVVVLLVWFSSATDKEREAISVVKKTRSLGNKGIRVVVFAGAGKLVPIVALLLLVDRRLIDLLDEPCRRCCSVPLMMPGMVKPSHLYPSSSSSGGCLVALRDRPGRRLMKTVCPIFHDAPSDLIDLPIT
jgi:hypothetical protein